MDQSRTDRAATLGLFFSSLDPEQTKLQRAQRPLTASDNLSHAERSHMERMERLYAGAVPTAAREEVQWRHAAWAAQRDRVWAAMVKAHLPAARINRFANCGAAACVEVDSQTGKARVRGFFCGDRFCEACCAARAARWRESLTAYVQAGRSWMLTLTLKHREETLSQMLDRLIKHFASMRRRKWWRDRVTGGAWTVEVKRGCGSGRWHLHIHAIIRADRFPRRSFWRLWKEETRDSTQVKAERITNPKKGAAYVAKYITKGWSAAVAQNEEDLSECLRSLGGRRLVATFGTVRPVDVDAPPSEPGRWRRVGSLVSVIQSAARREAWAVGLLIQLKQHGRETENPLSEAELAEFPRPPDPSPGVDRARARTEG